MTVPDFFTPSSQSIHCKLSPCFECMTASELVAVHDSPPCFARHRSSMRGRQLPTPGGPAKGPGGKSFVAKNGTVTDFRPLIQTGNKAVAEAKIG